MIINKGDTFKKIITFKKGGKPVDITGQIFVAVVKKEWQDDSDAIEVQILENHDKPEEGKTELKLNNLDQTGEYVIYIKSIDDTDKYTLQEIPLTIK